MDSTERMMRTTDGQSLLVRRLFFCFMIFTLLLTACRPENHTGQISYTSSNGENDEILLYTPGKSTPFNLTNKDYMDSWSSWSPDGSKMVFSSEQKGNWEIIVLDVQQETLTNISQNDAVDGWPVWSPSKARGASGSQISI
jgi:dipeptidyl aminopeptidase/acylaminoacyl peptidase